jgi:hypothetical protein
MYPRLCVAVPRGKTTAFPDALLSLGANAPLMTKDQRSFVFRLTESSKMGRELGRFAAVLK